VIISLQEHKSQIERLESIRQVVRGIECKASNGQEYRYSTGKED
jgi:hypothetical protein